MSFFFTKERPTRNGRRGAAGKPSTGQPPTAAARQNAPLLRRLGCKACPLASSDAHTPRMAPTLAKTTDIYILAEFPSKHEDEDSHRPLTGPAGLMLRECIPEGMIKYCSLDNVMNCRPPKGRLPVWQEITCCSPRREKWISEAKPKLILGLGIIPLQVMLGSSDMPGMRGRVFAVNVGGHKCWFLPTYHPDFIAKKAFNKSQPLRSMLGHCFRMDIQKAFRALGSLEPPKIDTEVEVKAGVTTFDGHQKESLPVLLDLLRKARKSGIKAIDLETKGLRPFAEGAAIMTAAVSYGTTNFAFAIDHPKAGWSDEQRQTVLDEFRELIVDNTVKIAHNAPFEIEWLIWLYGKDVVNHTVWQCTQMQAHFLDERRGKGSGDNDGHRASYQKLDFLCKQYFGTAYKSLFKLNKKDMSKADLTETLIYNGVDTKYTLRLYLWQHKLLRNAGLHKAYLEALPRQPTVALMQTLGVHVDQAAVKKAQKKLGGEITAIEEEITGLKVVKKYIVDHKEFNPLGDDAMVVFRDYLKRPEVAVKEESGNTRYSIDKNILDKIDHPLAKLIIQLRNRSKLKGTYVDGLELGVGEYVYPDSKIHSNFNTTFAETGRTSSDAPNAQNWPKRNDEWVRGLVVAPEGHVLLALDYGQLEGCTAAMCSEDKVLVKALWEDYDIHMEWAIKTADKYPVIVNHELDDKGVMKKFRSRIKNKLVFPAIFGAKNESIAGYLNMPVEIIDDLMDEFWSSFHGLKTWQDKLMKRYWAEGFVESPTGRRHHYPLTRNQAINHPIQSFACDIVCDAMNRLSYKAASTGQWHLHPIMNIHDDLTFVIPDDDRIIEESLIEIYQTMLSPPYSCVNVPLSVTASIGKRWYGMEEIGKFWSHKDV